MKCNGSITEIILYPDIRNSQLKTQRYAVGMDVNGLRLYTQSVYTLIEIQGYLNIEIELLINAIKNN